MESKEIRNAGLKVTMPRIKILQILESTPDRHLSAEDVYRALLEVGSEIGLATVYRVLTQFEAAGLVHRHNFDGGHSIFELASEEHHDHMVCVESGTILEFRNEEIERIQHEIAHAHGYTLVDHDLVLYVRPQNSTKAPVARLSKKSMKIPADGKHTDKR